MCRASLRVFQRSIQISLSVFWTFRDSYVYILTILYSSPLCYYKKIILFLKGHNGHPEFETTALTRFLAVQQLLTEHRIG